ncbi:hypothetical protein T492DRAFT_832567 [Pavlovales sp. CCMP2436]|nr:hypothetical protein T492DRAFT_832567 [Pavlovales sp. CCMP2436]
MRQHTSRLSGMPPGGAIKSEEISREAREREKMPQDVRETGPKVREGIREAVREFHWRVREGFREEDWEFHWRVRERFREGVREFHWRVREGFRGGRQPSPPLNCPQRPLVLLLDSPGLHPNSPGLLPDSPGLLPDAPALRSLGKPGRNRPGSQRTKLQA